MASLTQQPQLTPQPNLEPPGFDIIRDILMRQIIGNQASPYGYAGGQGAPSQQSLYTGNGRGTFDPYSGNYGPNPSSYPNAGSMAGPQMPQQGGGGGMYGFTPQQGMNGPPLQGSGGPGGMQTLQGPQMPMGQDGYTLNNQISTAGNFDACRMGYDGPMPGAPPMPMGGPQPGATGMMRPRPPMHAMRPPMNPHHGAAIKAIMAAMLAKRMGMGGGQRPPMRPPMGQPPMGGPPQMGPRPMGMDAPPPTDPGYRDWLTLSPMAQQSSTSGGIGSIPTGGDPRNSTQQVYNMQNQWAGGWGPRGGGIPPGATPPQPNNPNGGMGSNPGGGNPANSTNDVYSIENWFNGGGARPPSVPTPTPIGHDSPYNFQRGPMSPLGMDGNTQPGAGPGLPGPYASNFGGGGAAPAPAIQAIIQLLGGGGSGMPGEGGMDMMKRRQMGMDAKTLQGGKFVVAGRGGRPHRIFDEPRVV